MLNGEQDAANGSQKSATSLPDKEPKRFMSKEAAKGAKPLLKCAVEGCRVDWQTSKRFQVEDPVTGEQKRKRRRYRLFRLPEHPERREAWINRALIDADRRRYWKEQLVQMEALGMDPAESPFAVCEKHFENGEPNDEAPNPTLKLGTSSCKIVSAGPLDSRYNMTLVIR